MSIMMTVGGSSEDPMWLLGQIAAISVIAVLVWFGYKFINKGDKDGGVKIKVPKM